MKLKILTSIFIIIFSSNLEAKNYDIERSKYTKALKYFKNKNYQKFIDLKEQLKEYPLYANLEYKNLHKFHLKNDEKILQFIEKYKTTYEARKAYINLIYRLSRKSKYIRLISIYENIGSTDLECLYIRAKIKTNQVENIKKKIIPIWLSSKSQPKSCDFIFKWFYRQGMLSDELVWQRIKLSLDSGNYKLAKYLVRFLSNKNKYWANSLLKVYINPKKNLISKSYKDNNRYKNTIIRLGLNRISKNNYVQAKNYLDKSKKYYALSDKFYNELLEEIFIFGLKSNQKNIFNDKDFSSYQSKNIYFNLAAANYAIYNSDWNKILYFVSTFPSSIANEEKWIYWKGKALYKLKNDEYNFTLKKLSRQRSYYGFLSSHILNKKIKIENIPFEASPESLKILKKKYEVKRLYEFFLLGKKRSARKELQYLMEKNVVEDLNSLSILFFNWGWNDGAILSYGKSKYFNHIEARFPILYEKYFDKYSNSNIEKSLLLGIARKESIFIQYATSSAGALGIMQVLPNTANWVLKRSKMKKVSKNYLYNRNMNIYIGSYYFRYLYNKKRSYVEAIASYNAGPSVVRKWRKKMQSSEDAWIEFIPYLETRTYTKSVLEYALVYDYIQNKKNTIRISQLINID